MFSMYYLACLEIFNPLWNFTEENMQRRTHLKTSTTVRFSWKCSTFYRSASECNGWYFPAQTIDKTVCQILIIEHDSLFFKIIIAQPEINVFLEHQTKMKNTLIIIKCAIYFHTDSHSVNFVRNEAIFQILCFLHRAL